MCANRLHNFVKMVYVLRKCAQTYFSPIYYLPNLHGTRLTPQYTALRHYHNTLIYSPSVILNFVWILGLCSSLQRYKIFTLKYSNIFIKNFNVNYFSSILNNFLLYLINICIEYFFSQQFFYSIYRYQLCFWTIVNIY